MRVQLCLSLALYLMQNIEGVHASVPGLTSLITTSCNGPSDSDDLGSVEVTITQQNLSRLNLTSVEELRLLDSNLDCKPLPCCGGSSWSWQFSEESLCGGQLKVQVQDNYEIVTLGNVLYVNRNGSNMDDAKSWMAQIACSYLTNIPGSGMNALPLPDAMPDMDWSLFRTKSFQYFPEESQRITLNPSTYVGNWKEGGWLQLDINPSNYYELDDTYTGVHFTVNSYNLNFVHEQNGSNTTEVKPLIKNGCPPNSNLNFFFSGGTAHHEQVVTVVINLLHIAKGFARSNVRYMYVTFDISLCRDHGITAYRQIPECQGYSPLNCYQLMGESSPTYTVAYTSGLLTIWDPNMSNASRTPEPSRQTSVVSDTDTTTELTTTTASPSSSKQAVEEENESSDNTVNLKSYVVAIACVSCFICGCTLIGVIWMMYSHMRRIADLQSDSLSANQGSKYVRYDKSSLDSGILDSPLGSPVRGYSGVTFDPKVEVH